MAESERTQKVPRGDATNAVGLSPMTECPAAGTTATRLPGIAACSLPALSEERMSLSPPLMISVGQRIAWTSSHRLNKALAWKPRSGERSALSYFQVHLPFGSCFRLCDRRLRMLSSERRGLN